MIRIWDLDGTVIDSSHRYRAKPCGGIDLAAWVRLATPDNIMRDRPLPMARMMRKSYQRFQVVVCTARVMSETDFAWLDKHGLHYHAMLSRPEGMTTGDADYKEFQLRRYAHDVGLAWTEFCQQSIMYDDAPCILEHLPSIGIQTIDAKVINSLMAA